MFFNHDLSHIGGIRYNKIFNTGYNIAELLKKNNEINKMNIIINGMFLIFHELPLSGYRNTGSELEILIKAAQESKVSITSHLNDKREVTYKQDYRDWEFVLRTKAINGLPFLSSIAIKNGKTRPFPIVKRGDDFIIIEKQNEIEPGDVFVEKNADAPIKVQEEHRKLLLPALREAFTHFWNDFIKIIEEYNTKSI